MKMDPKGFYVYWVNQSKETTFLDVATVRDTRTGKYAKLPKHTKVRNVFNMDFPDSNHLTKTLTIVSGPDTVNLTYHNFFASKDKVSQNWANDILAIAYNAARNNACRYVFLEKIYTRLSLHTNKDGKIPVKNIYKMFPADKKRVESALASAHLPKGKFDTIKSDVFTESAFKLFLQNLCPRPEIYEIFTSHFNAVPPCSSNKPTMTRENFTKFLNEKQRDSRHNEELFPRLCYSDLISPEGLLFFLMGPETSVVMQDTLAKSQDMTQPIPHYFIKSSHNTYLTAGQFSGVSSPEMYRQCLLSGCRCLELDCWKGKPPEEEPIITHGFTMTTEILFKDVIEAIAESAFKTSQYPVILSFENHVDSVKQQEKMANYCKTIFGDALLTDPLDKYPLKPGQQIPSPSELMGKILIKNKKGSHEKPAQTKKTSTGATDPTATTGTAGQEVTAYEAMSSLVNYIQPNKFVSFDNARKKNKSYVISSFVETRGEAMISKTAVEFVEYNKRQMSRIYPKGTRMDSSNYSPRPFWNVGCQMVALNYQTMDFPMQLNMALFEFNGRTGYLLKHDVMRRTDKKFDPFCDRIDTVIASTLTIKIYSGQFLSDKSVKTGVEVELIGLPGDPKKKYRTKWSTTPNAINPVWNEEPFVFEKILIPEMASLRIVVHEENGKFLGHRIIPLDAIQSGFHHICLRSESNMPLTLPALFVYIEVKDYIPAAFAGAWIFALAFLQRKKLDANDQSAGSAPEAAEEAKEETEDKTDAPQAAAEPPAEDPAPDPESSTPETPPECPAVPDAAAPEKEAAREPEAPPAVTEEPANDPPAAPLPAADDATGPEAAGGPVAVAPPGPASAPAESVGSGDSSQPPASSEGITPMAHPALHSSQFQCQHCSLGGDPAAP
uniref:Phosphoinositide phospholipase C n=1 Tax=Gasterosteus aculeatus aculeatus TaxID=481459 RepID=A0AAQ4Q708_GASAC